MVTPAQYKQLKDYGIHLPKEMPKTSTIKTIRIKPHTPKKKKSRIPMLILGLIIGSVVTGFIIGIPQDYTEQVEQVSQDAYNKGIVDTIVYTQQTGLIKYIEGEEIKEISLAEMCQRATG